MLMPMLTPGMDTPMLTCAMAGPAAHKSKDSATAVWCSPCRAAWSGRVCAAGGICDEDNDLFIHKA